MNNVPTGTLTNVRKSTQILKIYWITKNTQSPSLQNTHVILFTFTSFQGMAVQTEIKYLHPQTGQAGSLGPHPSTVLH